MVNFLVNGQEWQQVCDCPEATETLGFHFAKELININRFPTLVLLCGPLGSGKTVFSRGIASGLGIDEPIQSPTFPILLEYPGRLPLYHFDLYRLEDSEEFDLIGGEDIIFCGGSYGPGLSLMEWPERLEWHNIYPPLPCFQVNLRIDPDGSNCQSREINICPLN